jgi:4'-phosphopantetheinyl transferase
MTRVSSRRAQAPPAGVVDGWCIALDAPRPPFEALLATMDDEERARARRMRVGGEAWAAAHAAMRTILADCLAMPAAALRFERTANGKPRLAGVRDLQFSLSRTEGLALLAVASDREVGVDVERENDETDIDAVTREFLSSGDGAVISSAAPADRRAAFFAAWAKREARIKLRGEALEAPLEEPALSPGALVVTRVLTLRPGYAAAIAAEGGGWTIQLREFAFPMGGETA